MSPLTINTQDFSDPEFNPKKWINSVLKPTQENSEEDETKETTVLVTKLQMASEDASRQFEQLSNSIIKSMPRVSYDLKQISENARVIQHKILSAQQKLTLLQRDTGGALEQLRRPHTVKTRMEKCQVLFDELKQDKENKATNEQGKEKEIVKEEQEQGEKDLSLPVDPATLLDLENPLQIHPNTESLKSNSQENTPQANNVLKKIGVPLDKLW